MSLSARPDPTGPVVHLHGELDCLTGPDLELTLTHLLTERGRLIADLAGLSFLDCAGLGSLVAVHRWAGQHGKHLTFAHPTPGVHRLLDTLGSARIGLHVEPDRPVPTGRNRAQ
jgi:anti-anti-sigma factor